MATVYSGGTYVSTTFTAATQQALLDALKTHLGTAGWTRVSLGSGLGPGNVATTVTITIASPGVVSFASHGFLGGERVILRTTGALPTGLSAGTIYFVKFVDANTFRLATTSGGADINTSGSQSGTHSLYSESIVWQSATAANVTNPIRVRVKDTRNTTGVLGFSIENSAGSVVGGNSNTAGGQLLTQAAQVFRIVATKYWFMCCYNGAPSAQRQYVYAGMIYVPTLLTGVTDVGVMLSNSQTDVGAGSANNSSAGGMSFRTGPCCSTSQNASPNYQLIYNSTILENANNGTVSSIVGAPKPILQYPNCNNAGGVGSCTDNSYRWANDSLLTADVLLAWGAALHSDEAKIRGQFYDMVFIGDAFAVDTVDTFSGHDWINITSNNTTYSPRGGMWCATS